MTREEEIKFIDAIKRGLKLTGKDYPYRDEYIPKMKEALDMAIKVLEREPCEDCISRQAVFEQIGGWIASGEYEFTNATDYLSKRIKAITPVTPQPKMGRWITLKDEYGDVVEAVCSCCDNNGTHKWAFCPYCGTKMEVEEC